MAPNNREPRVRRSAGEARRLLVAAARDALLEGAGDLEVAQVVRRAGVSEALAYYHFGSKAGLLDAVVRDFYTRLDDAVLAVPIDGASWRVRERARTHEFVRLMYEDPLAPLVVNVVRADPALRVEEHERQRRLHRLGSLNIAAAQRSGEIRPDLDPALLVAMILGGVMAGVSEALAQAPPKPLEQTQEEVWSFVERAVGYGASARTMP